MDDDLREYSERKNDPTRVLALSDGVFAIILTLLVLELHVPDLAGDEGLWDALREIRPSFVAFLISFVIVASAWARHRDLFSLIRRTDRLLVWLNLVALLPLCVLPFGASLLSRYDRDPIALQIYGLILIAAALTRLAIWAYVTGRPDLLVIPIDARARQMGTLLAIALSVAYVIGILLSGRAPTVSLAIYALAPVMYFSAITLARSNVSGVGDW